MKALWDPELEVLPDGGRRLWWFLVLVNHTYLYMSHYIIHNIHALEFTSDECKDYSPNKLNKEHMKRNLKALRYTKKRPLYANERRQLGGEPPMHNKSVVKTFYNRDIISRWLLRRSGWWIANPWQDIIITEEVPHGYVLVFQQRYTLLIRATKKNQCSRPNYIWNQALHYEWSPERRKWFSDTYPHRWADKKTSW